MYPRNFLTTRLKLSRHYLLIPIVLVVFYFLFYLIYDDIKKRTINEFNNEQLILAQTAAQGITLFFEDYQDNLTFLSQSENIIDFSEDGEKIMENFYKNHQDLIEGFTRVDEHGIILFTYPLNQSVIGNDISVQEHVRKIITTHQPVLSDVFLAVQGYLAIALHVPIFKGEEYKGSLAMLIPIDKIGERYLGKIKIRGTGNVWLLTENGIEIYCPVNGHKGNSFLNNTQNDQSALELFEKIKKESFGTAKSVHHEVLNNGNAQFIEKYVAFYRATLGNTFWTIFISYQEKDIYVALSRLQYRLIFVFALLFMIMSYYFYSLTKVRTILREEEKRKKAEKTLRESEVRLKTIFDESPIGIELYKADGFQLTANKASLRMFGITDITELHKFNLFDGTSLDAEKIEMLRKGMSVSYQAIFDFEKVKNLGQYNSEKSGKAYFDYIITPLFNPHDKQLDGYLVQVQDISARKRDEEEILILAHALKSVNECVTITDMQNRILFVNEAFTKTYGYSDDELIGNKINLVRLASDFSGLYNDILPATLQGGWKGELINVRKDGSEFPIYLSTTIIRDKNKNPIGLIGVASDITERKQKEEELVVAKEKAEESDRLKSAFLANMSHEIRTPMNGILGFAGLLKEPELTGEEQKKYIAVIEKSGHRMLNIINDIIDISKIEAGQVKLTIKDADLNVLSDYLFNFFKPEIIKKGLTFFCNVSPKNDHLIIKTDKEKLSAILTNLLKNAIKYTQEGTIEFGYVSTGSTTQTPDNLVSEVGERWRLSETETSRTPELQFYVKDTGIGIPKDRQQAIFDRFVQADIEDKKAMEGAGLGLAISTAYAKMLGGNIQVESEPGKGSTFYLNLPLQQSTGNISEESINREVEKPLPQIIKDFTILIAEDEATSDFYLTEILKTECKQILHAANGAEAVETCRKNPGIALVLMDIKMPLMNGYEASQMIRSFNKNVIIVAQTAYALSGDREKAISSGCNDYLSKPIAKSELFAIIERNLKN